MSQDSKPAALRDQIQQRFSVEKDSLTPPLPEKISIEVNNSCNHRCFFCQNPTMERTRRVMDPDLVYRVLDEAHAAGVRTASFFSGGEPFLNKHMADFVRHAKTKGFNYVYLSSNGGKATKGKIVPVLEAGLDSLKFSVNAGTRDSYKVVHGLDEFDEVMASIEEVLAWRAVHRPTMKVFVSFVATPLNQADFPLLEARFKGRVNEVIRYPFAVVGTPVTRRADPDGTERPHVGYEDVDGGDDINQNRLSLPCYQLWGYLNVTVEGYLSACCSDYNNDLIVGSLHGSSLVEAWHSPEFQRLRQEHKDGHVAGTLCDGCINRCDRPYEPINTHLKTKG